MMKRAQNEVFNQDTQETIFVNGSDDTNPLPLISTTAGTLKYTPSASNLVDSDGNAISLTVNGYAVSIRKILHVFINTSDLSQYNNTYVGRIFQWSGTNDNWTRKLYKARYREVPLAANHPKSAAEDAYFVFAEDPGTHADWYYVEFYFGPIDLTAETIPMSFDTDKWFEAVLEGVLGYAELSKNGRSEHLDRFRQYWIPKIRSEFNHSMTDRRPFVFESRDAG